MGLHPDLAALRSNPAAQRRAQAALGAVLEGWHRAGPVAACEADLAAYAEGRPLARCSALGGLFDPASSSAAQLVRGLIGPLVTALAAHPIAAVPLRHYADDAAATLVLAQAGTAVLSLQALDPVGIARQRPATTAVFAAGAVHERILAGHGAALRVRLAATHPGGARLEQRPAALHAGQCRHRDSGRETRIITRLDAPLVLLRLQKRPGSGALTREYALADGRFVAQAAGNPRETRLELLAALLGRMGRTDAAPLLAAMAEEEAGESLRWQALKECLTLDTAAGFAALCRVAGRADDSLAAPAGALRAQLLETYPQLEALI